MTSTGNVTTSPLVTTTGSGRNRLSTVALTTTQPALASLARVDPYHPYLQLHRDPGRDRDAYGVSGPGWDFLLDSSLPNLHSAVLAGGSEGHRTAVGGGGRGGDRSVGAPATLLPPRATFGFLDFTISGWTGAATQVGSLGGSVGGGQATMSPGTFAVQAGDTVSIAVGYRLFLRSWEGGVVLVDASTVANAGLNVPSVWVRLDLLRRCGRLRATTRSSSGKTMKKPTVARNELRERLATRSALPVAVAVGSSAWTMTGHFALEGKGKANRAPFVLSTVEELVCATRGALTMPLGRVKGCFARARVGERGGGRSLSAAHPSTGAVAVTVRRGIVEAISARWSRARAKAVKVNAAAARALVTKRFTLDDPMAPKPDVPAPSLALLDPSAIGAAGPVQSVWVFGTMGVEPVHDVIVAADGHTIVDVIAVQPGGDAPTLTQTPRYLLHPVHGTPRFVSFPPLGLLLPEAASGDATRTALAFFQRHPRMFGTWDAANQLLVDDVIAEPVGRGMKTVVMRQQMGPFPVWGAQLRVHLTPDLAIRSISGSYVHEPQADVRTLIAEAVARSKAFVVWSQGEGDRAGLGFPIESRGRVIVPIRLDREATQPHNELCYWFRFPDAERFVSTISGSVVYERCPAVRTCERSTTRKG